MDDKIRVAILGAGGLGQAMGKILQQKESAKLVGVCDRFGAVFCQDGLTDNVFNNNGITKETVGHYAFGIPTDDPFGEILKHKEEIDGIFVALPNLPNEFIPNVVSRFADAGYSGVMVDAIKRSRAVELMMKLNDKIAKAKMTYVTGCGATPGLLTAAANLAAMSFVEIKKVEIYFGVGISNWSAYRATIREDIGHLPGFSVEKAAKMSDAEVEKELDFRKGILELTGMEHADDVILEFAGVCDRSKITVGGIVDTKNPKKPVSTNVKITGITFEGKQSTHTFTLGDETSMAANVCGPALGYLHAGIQLNKQGIYGIQTSATVMPRFMK